MVDEPANDVRAARPHDLAPHDWLEAGQSLLRAGGLRALKLRPLASALRVSTGSFYHHFDDFDEYQGLLADYFSGAQIAELIDAITRAEVDPVGRIRLLAQLVRRRGMSRLSIAMRAWAESDPRALAAVQRHDEQVLGFLAGCMQGCGFARHDAMVRAYGLMTLGLSKVHAPELNLSTLMDEMIVLFCRTPVDAAVVAIEEDPRCPSRATTISS